MKAWQWLLQVSFFVLLVMASGFAEAANLASYSNTLSDSGPSEYANHTYRFEPVVSVGAGASINITLPNDFTFTNASTTFAERNVELYVNNALRTASTIASPGVDQVIIDVGSPQKIIYNLAPDASIAANSLFELRVGNHTSGSLLPVTTFSTSTGTTTTPGDSEPIRNSATLGLHKIPFELTDGVVVADAEFNVFLNEKVRIPNVDTTETVPPFRFNPTPTSTVGGTTLNVEIGLETDELAICKFDTVPGTAFNLMPTQFSNTGFLIHTTVVPVVPDSVQTFYVRCIDDEFNFNIDDFLITFTVSDQPTGISNTDGDVDGDGTGTGNDGSGSGSGAGGQSGDSDGEQPDQGTTSGSGGNGGGGGGGSGGNSGASAGGGFESTDAPFESGDARVIVSGYAYPGSRVTLLVDGQFVDDTSVSNNGEYSMVVDSIARGAYTFGVYAEDRNGTKSSTFSTSFTIAGARATRLSNINVSPSVVVEPDPAEPGEIVTFSGYALPDSTVTVEYGESGTSRNIPLQAFANSSGEWSTTVDTTGFARNTYQVRAKSERTDNISTNFSNYSFFGLGQDADRPLSPDLNRDGSVNLIDFSILLFWWQTNGGDSDPPADINQDGGVNLTDFSILLFNWTG